MEQEYLYHLLLDCFQRNVPVKSNSLYHILTGKRTVSVFLMAMRKGLAAAFQMMPKLTSGRLDIFIRQAEEMEEIVATEEGFLLTDRGAHRVEAYFDSGYPRMNQVSQVRYARILSTYQKRTLFLTQVLSNSRYRNKDYIPLEQRFTEQQFIKTFLSREQRDKETIGVQLGEEWLELMGQLEHPEVFVEQMEGYQTHRKTANQVAAERNIPVGAVEMMWHQDWLRLMDNCTEGQLLGNFLLLLQSSAGLCAPSVQETYQYLGKDETISSIAEKRKLKESTIADHITEMALLQPAFPFSQFLPDELMAYATNPMNREVPTIEEVRTLFAKNTFFETRLLQVKMEVDRLWNKH